NDILGICAGAHPAVADRGTKHGDDAASESSFREQDVAVPRLAGGGAYHGRAGGVPEHEAESGERARRRVGGERASHDGDDHHGGGAWRRVESDSATDAPRRRDPQGEGGGG